MLFYLCDLKSLNGYLCLFGNKLHSLLNLHISGNCFSINACLNLVDLDTVSGSNLLIFNVDIIIGNLNVFKNGNLFKSKSCLNLTLCRRPSLDT